MKFQCFSLFSLLEFDSPFVLFCFPFEAAEIKKKKPKRKKPNQVLILSGVLLCFFLLFLSFTPKDGRDAISAAVSGGGMALLFDTALALLWGRKREGISCVPRGEGKHEVRSPTGAARLCSVGWVGVTPFLPGMWDADACLHPLPLSDSRLSARRMAAVPRRASPLWKGGMGEKHQTAQGEVRKKKEKNPTTAKGKVSVGEDSDMV